MNRRPQSLAMLGALQAIAIASAPPGLMEAAAALTPRRGVSEARTRRRGPSPEVIAHNAEVDRKRAEKKARKLARRGDSQGGEKA